MGTLRPKLFAACATALVVVSLVSLYLAWMHRNPLRPISQFERIAIERAIASFTNITGTNISEIQRLESNRVRVYTKSASGSGGDILELQETGGEWLLRRRGAWIP
jgi:hypothetical protein